MQITELYRRGVVTPLTDDAAAILARWEAAESTQVHFLPISSEFLFDAIWQTGVFEDINSACDTLIDDYEEECVPLDALPYAISAIELKCGSQKSADVRQFLTNLAELCTAAMDRKQPVYFIL